MSNASFHLIRNAVMGACAMLLLAQGPAAAANDFDHKTIENFKK